MSKKVKLETLDDVTIRFAGDSGDGMQLSGGRFTQTSAIAGNDLSTLPDFPAEIRAPAGSLAGVSSFQIHFSSHEIHTPGEEPEKDCMRDYVEDSKNKTPIIPCQTQFINPIPIHRRSYIR